MSGVRIDEPAMGMPTRGVRDLDVGVTGGSDGLTGLRHVLLVLTAARITVVSRHRQTQHTADAVL